MHPQRNIWFVLAALVVSVGVISAVLYRDRLPRIPSVVTNVVPKPDPHVEKRDPKSPPREDKSARGKLLPFKVSQDLEEAHKEVTEALTKARGRLRESPKYQVGKEGVPLDLGKVYYESEAFLELLYLYEFTRQLEESGRSADLEAIEKSVRPRIERAASKIKVDVLVDSATRPSGRFALGRGTEAGEGRPPRLRRSVSGRLESTPEEARRAVLRRSLATDVGQPYRDRRRRPGEGG